MDSLQKNAFLTLLEKGPVVFDGAMGTMFFDRGIFINRCFDELNLVEPHVVRGIHREYALAGADVLETNTFGANRFKLKDHGLADKLEEINRRGVLLAREAAAGTGALVAGAIGPLCKRIEPWGPISIGECREAFREQAAALLAGGVDLIVLETFGNLQEIGEAMAGVKEAMAAASLTGLVSAPVPVVAQMSISEDANSLFGTEPQVWVNRLDAWGADVIGINCSVGPKTMLEVLERVRGFTDKPLSVQPMAGRPTQVDGRLLYLCSPDYIATYGRRFIQAGARAVGGCCGTTPEHIRVLARSVRQAKGMEHKVAVESVREEVQPPVELEEVRKRSGLAERLVSGQFVASCELLPPRGWDLALTLERVEAIKKAGFHAVNIPDGPRASAKLGPMAMAVMVQNQLSMEAVMHFACRDRNLLGMQSDLLGAYALGLRNLLLITGDPPVLGDYPDATAVFDIDSIGLTNMVRQLNSGKDLGGRSIGKPTGFLIGVGANPTAVNPELELKRYYWKVDAGADFAITQPVFDVEQLERFLDRVDALNIRKIPIVAGIWPVQSLRNAEFMRNEVPGVHVPDSVLQRMADVAGDPAGEVRVGVDIAVEILVRIHKRVQGVQIAAPLNRHTSAIDVLNRFLAKENVTL